MQPKDMSDNQWCKASGWGSKFHFMRSYQLSVYKDEDMQEGKAIIDAFRKDDQEEWEREQRENQGQK